MPEKTQADTPDVSLDDFLENRSPNNECWLCAHLPKDLRSTVEASVLKRLNAQPRRVVSWLALQEWLRAQGYPSTGGTGKFKRHFDNGHYERT